jgi:hypothetical protein
MGSKGNEKAKPRMQNEEDPQGVFCTTEQIPNSFLLEIMPAVIYRPWACPRGVQRLLH